MKETASTATASDTPGIAKSTTQKRQKRQTTTTGTLGMDENLSLKQYKNIKIEKV